MPFDPNDYPLGEEYRARMMRQVDQDHLAQQARASSSRRAIPSSSQLALAVAAIFLTVTLFVAWQYALA